METEQIDRNWLSREQLAEYLSVSQRTVSNWTSQRKIPFCKIKGVLRFDREAVDRHLRAISTQPISAK